MTLVIKHGHAYLTSTTFIPDQTNKSIYLANWWFCISRSRSLSALRSNPEKPLLVLLLWAMAGPTCWVAPGWLLSLDMDKKCSEEKWGGLTSCWLCILLGVWDLVGGADSIQCSELGVWASGCYNVKKMWKYNVIGYKSSVLTNFLRNQTPSLESWMESAAPTRSHMQSSSNIQHNIKPLYFFSEHFLPLDMERKCSEEKWGG